MYSMDNIIVPKYHLIFRAHIRLWDTETLETHCVLGLGEYELRADAVAFSSSVDGDILLCGKIEFILDHRIYMRLLYCSSFHT